MSGQALGPLPVAGEVSSATAEPPDSEPEGPVFAEMDPTGRYGRFNEVLGRGACKAVYKAFDTEEGTEMAWNQVRGMEFMNGKDSENREERERIFAEVRVLKALKHKNIMSFRDSWYDPRGGTINFITELFTSGTLRQYRRRHRQLDPEVLKGWAWQILCGLVYLHGHSPPIIHRDLKCDNIFINGSDGVVKIGDLGLATLLRQRTAPQSVLGTPEFMAPELYEEEYDDRVDVYSFGMCLLELATMEYPYVECKNAAQIYRKVSLGIRPAGLQKVPPGELHQLINVCLLPREQRPRARTLLKHPFFESIRAGQGSLAGVRSEAALAAAVGAPADVASRAPSASSDYAPPLAESSLRSNLSDWRLNDIIEEEVSEELATNNARNLDDHLRPGARASSRLASPTPSARDRSGGGVLSPERALSPQSVPSRTVSAASSHASAAGPFAEGAGTTTMSSSRTGGVEAGAGSSPSPSDALAATTTTTSDAQQVGRSPSTGAPPPVVLASPERRFAVVGKFREEKPDEYALRLRIAEPGGGTRTVEFSFDLSRDTAMSVAGEMVEELALSPADAADIAAAIREEIAAMSSDLEATLSMNLEAAGEALRAGILHSANSANGVGATLEEDEKNENGQQQLDLLGREEVERGIEQEEEQEGLPARVHKSGDAKPVTIHPSSGDTGGLEPVVPVDDNDDRPPSDADETTILKAGAQPSSHSETNVQQKETSDSSPQLVGTDSSAAPKPVSTAAAQPVSTLVPNGPMIRRASPPPLVVRRSTSYEAQGLISGSLSSGGFSLGSPGGGSSGEATPHLGPTVLPSRASLTELAAAARAAVLSSSFSAEGIGLTRDVSPSGRGGTALSDTSSAANPPRDAGPRKLQALRQLFQEQQAHDAPEEVPAAVRDVRLGLTPGTSTSPLLAAAIGHPVAGLPPLSPTRARAHSNINNITNSTSETEGRPAHLPPSRSLEDCSDGCDGTAMDDQLSINDPVMVPSVAVEALDLASGCSPRQHQLSAPNQTSSTALGSATDAFSIEAFGVAAKLAGIGVPLVEAGTSMSAPVSSLVSRETSPQRDNDEQCTDGCAPTATGAATNKAGKAGPVPPMIKDKELLRKAAADTMKAVELRALNLLEGGGGAVLAGRGGIRGTPMAACRAPPLGSTMAAAVPITAMAGPPLGTSNGLASMPNGHSNSAPLAGEGLLRSEASSNGNGGAAAL